MNTLEPPKPDASGRTFLQRYSENIAGGLSLAGSALILTNSFHLNTAASSLADKLQYNGDPTNIMATSIFTAAEIVMIRSGNTTRGYSAGMAGFCAGDIILAFSDTAQNHPAVRATFLLTAGALGIGAMKYPVECMARSIKSDLQKSFHTAANALPKICSMGAIATKLPAIAAALEAQSYKIATAVGLWATADILAGRLQEQVSTVLKLLKKKTVTKKNVPQSGSPEP